MNLKYGPYSPSRLDTARCPYSFYKQYVDPERVKQRTDNLPQARGHVVHEVLEIITDHHKSAQTNKITMDDIKTWVTRSILEHPAAYEETGAIIEMARLYTERPPKVLTTDAETEKKMGIKLSDNGLVECSYDDPQAFARGIADIMMISDDLTEAIVYDHKTQPNIEDADTFQLGFYAWVILKTFPFLKKLTTILHFARYGSYRAHEWTRDELVEIENEIMVRVSVIESMTSWDAIPHDKCQYCPVKFECPRWSEMFDLGDNGLLKPKRFMTLAEGGTEAAVRFAGNITVLEDTLELMKKELKTYVSMTSPIAIPGKVYEFRAKEGIDWDKVNKKFRKQVYDVFEECGKDPKEYMGFSQTFSKDMWRSEDPKLCEKLGELIPRKTTTEFRGYKL